MRLDKISKVLFDVKYVLAVVINSNAGAVKEVVVVKLCPYQRWGF